ncbi:lysylphosphatidylglycerol synthase transmembrane domain-containing protein [Mycoplasma crocodyli]|uniref:Putative membrane protein n=1 Tax=Mycoplasma crocodyli (strain ATCC 51981 / MP145) TaxID=512564 RepID=D5E6G4_MYCCM|nr:lysylphosphatidylglycerol synthase transmembrane domain-containing protein [Mycoplasma crocodyli]ADE19579.1 putative membrane protein [Mycoplasma crocodyli MP145]
MNNNEKLEQQKKQFINPLNQIDNTKKIGNLFYSKDNFLKVYKNKIYMEKSDEAFGLKPETILLFANFFSLMIKENKQNSSVFINYDDKKNSNLYANIFARTLYKNGIKINSFKDSSLIPKPIKFMFITKSNSDYIVDFSSFLDDEKSTTISFFYGNGNVFSEKIVSKMVYETIQNSQDLSFQVPVEKYEENFFDHHIYNYLSKNKINFDGSSYFTITDKTNEFFYKNFLKSKTVSISKSLINISCNSTLRPLQLATLKGKLKSKYISFLISNEGYSLRVAISKKRTKIKYLTADEIAVLYLDNIIKNIDKNELKNKYIVKTIATTSFINEWAKVREIKIKEVDEYNYEQVISDKNALLYFNEDYVFLSYDDETQTNNSYKFLEELSNILNRYKKIDEIVDYIDFLTAPYNHYYNEIMSFNSTYTDASKFLSRIKLLDKIENETIIRKDIIESGFDKPFWIVKIYLSNGTSIILKYSMVYSKITYYVQNKWKTNESKILAITNEKTALRAIEDIKNDTVKIKRKYLSVIKYLVFVLITILIFVFLFTSVYQLEKKQPGVDTTKVFWKLFSSAFYGNYKIKIGVVSIFSMVVVDLFITSLYWKRSLTFQHQKVTWRDVITISFIGKILQKITPKSLGADVGNFWYLRKKGVPGNVIVSVTISSTIIYQIKSVVQGFIIIPLGLYLFSDIFYDLQDKNTQIFIAFLVLGIFVDTMIGLVVVLATLVKKVQNFLLKLIIFIGTKIVFLPVLDWDKKRANYEEILSINRKTLKMLLTNWKIFLELFFYKFIQIFTNGLGIYGILSGAFKTNLAGGTYFNAVFGYTLADTANAISITPGGSGTAEYFIKQIFSQITQSTTINIDKHGKFESVYISTKDVSTIVTAVNSVASVIIPSLLSALFLLTVYIGETRKNKYARKRRNLCIMENNDIKNVKLKTTFYVAATIVWVVGIAVVSGLYMWI